MASPLSPLTLVSSHAPARRAVPPHGTLFSQYGLDTAYDEMFDRGARPHAHYRALVEELLDVSPDELRRRQLEADRAFLTQGITLTVCRDHWPQLEALANRYAVQSPDLADLCLIRMSELHQRLSVITVDRQDFKVYRRNKRETIPIICPPGE